MDEEMRDVDVTVEVSHLRQPFVTDLSGVILGAAEASVGENGGYLLTPQAAFDLLVGRIMELVDELVDEVTTECLRQTAAALGGELVEDELFVSDFTRE